MLLLFLTLLNSLYTVQLLPHLTIKTENDGDIGPGVLACATRGGGRSAAGHCFHLLFFFFFFFFSSSFSYAFCFSPTLGNLPCVKICFPQYFGITRRYMQKKNIFLGNFFPPQKKRSFSRDFSRRPAFGRGAWTNP